MWETQKKKKEQIAIKEKKNEESPTLVYRRHFEEALKRVLPSVSTEDVMRYESMRKKLRRARGQIGSSVENSSNPSQDPSSFQPI